ncbi:MAG: SDR family NAD(P)-dependent oxidoreductase [Cyclobacteriaceae bacterium]
MPKRITITGASGHLGTALLEPLIKKGYSVQAQYRSSVPPVTHPNLNLIQGEITDLNFLQKLFKDCDAVIHCAGMISLGSSDKEKVIDTNITGTEKVVEAILTYKNTRLIHISSTNAIAELPQDQIHNESSPLKTNESNIYGYSKAKSEGLVLDAIKNKELNAIIIRPSALVGPPDYRPSLLGQSILDLWKAKIPALPAGGYDYVDLRDVVDSIIRSIELNKPGEIYNLTGKYYSMKDMSKVLSEASERRISPWIIPIPIMVCLLPLARFFSLFMQRKSAFTYESLMTLKYGHKNMSHEKAAKDLAHSPRILKETLGDLIDWFEKEKDRNDS